MDKNINILEHMYNYCKEIDEDCNSINNSKEEFEKNKVYQKAITMSLLQIGELTTHLTEDFKEITSSEIDWRNLKGLRNIIAHRYGSIQFDLIWEIKEKDVPEIKQFCKKYIELNKSMNAYALESEDEASDLSKEQPASKPVIVPKQSHGRGR